MEPERPVTLGDWLDVREEMRAAEALLEEMQFAPSDLAAYWALSAALLALLQEVEEHLEDWRLHGPRDDEGERYLAVRRRLVALLARTEEIGLPTEADKD